MAKKKSAGKERQDENEVDFETAMATVEKIVSELEGGQLDLTEALQRYEQGVRELKACHAILARAEQRVTVLSGFDADGNPVTEPLPHADSAAGRPATGVSGCSDSGQTSMDDSPGLF